MEDGRRTTEPAGAAPQEARWELPGYTHGRELGAGASGRVVMANHDATGTPVAVKYLSGETADHRGFRTEAELLADLSTPYVAQLYEYVESPHGAAIVMELVDGISLRELLRAEGATAPEAALTVLKGSLLGLAAAHEAGVVHRDYKPANVLVAADGSSKLVDFGIAVRSGETGAVAGTPAYMAPEQWAGDPASPATDVYAATATFFECLTGAKPYAGTTLVELAVQHAEAEIPDTEVPDALRPLIRAGLAKTPQERPDGAAALAAELEAAAGSAYGEDWEERGRRQLAALVALLPLLLPGGGGEASGTTAFATTRLGPPDRLARFGRRARLLSTAAVVVLAGGALASVATAGATDPTAHTEVAAPKATTSFTPHPSATTPRTAVTAPPSPSPTDSPSPSASASTTPAPSTSATPSPKPVPTLLPTVSASASVSVPITPPPPPLHVISVLIEADGCYGPYGTVASVTVTTDGAADGTLTLTWLDSAGKGTRPTVVGTDTIVLPKGKTQVTGRYTHYFGSADTALYWGVRAATNPAADSGQNAYREVYALTCNPPR